MIRLARPSLAEVPLADLSFTPGKPLADRERFETWSQIALDAIAAGAAS